MCPKFWSENLKGKDHSEELGIAGKIGERIFRETGWEGMDWIHIAHDRDQWQALVDTIMNLQVP
jgi:hypothetical protein